MSRPEALPTSAFDYELPPGRIAQHPADRRDESRLLVLHRDGGRIEDRVFRDLVDYTRAGDVLVLNETRVFPARLVGRKPTGAAGEVLLLRPVDARALERGRARGPDPAHAQGQGRGRSRGRRGSGGGAAAGGGGVSSAADGVSHRPEEPGAGERAPAECPRTADPPTGRPGTSVRSSAPADPHASAATADMWEALVRPGGKLKPGRVLEVGPELRVEIVDSTPDGGRIVRLDTPLAVDEALRRYGRVPLPPYIDREVEAVDAERYQTVYAERRGSVAAPTAGLHFTPAVLAALRDRDVRLARLVLHVGVGTFRPVEHEDPAAHRMHAEWYEVPTETADAIRSARAAAGRVWAVGTTVTRALESSAAPDGCRAGSGWTRLFIRPPYRFRVVDRLITNFHLPRSTLLMLVSAFGGHERVMRAYAEAIDRGYRFYSYGDAMAIV